MTPLTLSKCAGSQTAIQFAVGEMLVRHHPHAHGDCISLSAPGVHPKAAPVVRIHSACLFGEAFASQECDCKAQLEVSLRTIAEDGGALVYLFQEGRGVGICSKIAAMNLQRTKGLTTVEAFTALGFPPDPRSYETAIAALKSLNTPAKLRVISNNPKKLQALKDAGYDVVERLEPQLALTRETASLVLAKQLALGQIPYSPDALRPAG